MSGTCYGCGKRVKGNRYCGGCKKGLRAHNYLMQRNKKCLLPDRLQRLELLALRAKDQLPLATIGGE